MLHLTSVHCFSYFFLEAVLFEGLLEVDETQQRPDGREHALPYVVSTIVDIRTLSLLAGVRVGTYRGCLSASSSTTSTPSLAKADAAYEPAGPPPATRTVQDLGTDIVFEQMRTKKAKVVERSLSADSPRVLGGIIGATFY